MDRGAGARSEPERPLRLDATREEALEHAAKLVAEAWRSFDRFRPEEPALDDRVRELIRGALPEEPVPVHEALDDAARILDESIAQPRPRYFAFIGSSGLEIGTIGDLLAETIDADLAAGVTPVAVIATAGTTLTGAVDPIGELADVCGPRDVWLHVDGAYGLPAAAVRPELFDGLERADSCSIDAHKWLYVPKACGVVMSRHAGVFAGAFAHEEGYLPHQQHELHAADITLEYSRPFRALKAWLAFRAHGARQFRDAITKNLDEAELLYRHAQVTEDFEVMEAPPQLSITPIRHMPGGVVPNPHNQALADAIQSDGRVYLASALIDGDVWLRPCFVNFRTTEDDVLALMDVARALGERLARDGI